MSKLNQGETLVKEIKAKQKRDFKDSISNSSPVLVLKGLWMFAEGTSLIVTSLYAIYQGHYGSLPTWGAYVLTVAGVLVLVPAALLLSKFFRQVGNAR